MWTGLRKIISITNSPCKKAVSEVAKVTDKLNIGIIGCGHWGPNFIRNFKQIKNASVKYACDINPKRLTHIKSLYPDTITTRDYRQIIKDKQVNAVVIATPANTHYALVKESILNGKHALVEKPIATNLYEAKELVEIAEENKAVLMVGHTFKFNPGINKLRELIQTGKLGPVFYIYSRRTNLGPLRKDVNAMWDLAPHDISIVSYLLNAQPIEVSARGRIFLEHNLEDIAFLTLTYPKNIFVHAHVSWLDPRKVREIIVVGSKKMAVFDDLNIENPIKIYDKSIVKRYFKQDYDTFEEFQMIIREGRTFSPVVQAKEPLRIECDHFIECVRKGLKPLTDGKDGLDVLKAMTALQESLDKDGISIRLGRVY